MTEKETTERLAEFVFSDKRVMKIGTLYYDDNKKGYWKGTWNPLENWNATMMVVEKLARSGGTFDLSYKEGKVNQIRINEVYYEMVDGNVQKSICMAALATLPTEGDE